MAKSLKLIVEALLFASDKPLAPKEIHAVLPEVKPADIAGALRVLRYEYEAMGRSFALHEVGGGFQFRSRPEYGGYILKMLQASPARLSRATMETLAIIAYRQPIGRVEIEYIRGVGAAGVIRTLQDRDLIDVQSEIASSVVTEVLPRFAASGKQAPPPPTQDPIAYDLYLLGRQKLREVDDFYARADDLGARTAASQAAEHFLAAIASDPRFAQAHASLALAKLTLAYDQIDERTPEAQAAAMDREVLPDIERALEADPTNAEAYFAKGRLLRATFRPGAEAAFRRAVELDPSNAPATVSLGYAMLTHGHVDERYRLVRRALELDPMDLRHHSASITAAWIMAKPEDVRALTARMLKLFPDHPRARLIACEAFSYLGQPDEAVACAVAAAAQFARDPPLAALRDEHFLDHVVDRDRGRVERLARRAAHVQRSIGQDRRPRGAHRTVAGQARTARMDADDVVILQPQLRDRRRVAAVERLVEGVLALLRRGKQQRARQA